MNNTEPIFCCLIGNSSNRNDLRRVEWRGLNGKNWKSWVSQWITPARDLGYRRFALTNPGGTVIVNGDASDPANQMHFSQLLQARDAGLTWLVADLAEILRDGANRGEEWITYLGSMHLDPSFTRIQETVRALDAGAARAAVVAAERALSDRAAMSAQIPIEGHASIAIDSLSDAPLWETTLANRIFVPVRKNKRTIYMETWAKKGDYRVQLHPDMGIWAANHGSAIKDMINAQATWAMKRADLGERPIVLHLAAEPCSIKVSASADFMKMWEGCAWNNLDQWIQRWNAWARSMNMATTIPGDQVIHMRIKRDSLV